MKVGKEAEESGVRNVGVVSAGIHRLAQLGQMHRLRNIPPVHDRSTGPPPGLAPSYAHHPPGLPPSQPLPERPRRPIPWGPVLGLACTVLAFVGGFSWQASRADTTLSAAVTGIEELKTDQAETAGALADILSELRGLREDSADVSLALATLGALQYDHKILVVQLEERANGADRERARIAKVGSETARVVANLARDNGVYKRRLSFFETFVGITQPQKGDSP